MSKQLGFQNLKRYKRVSFGGGKSTSHQKYERPLSTKKWIHLVLKSSRAKGEWSFLRLQNKIFIKQLVLKKAKQHGVTVGGYENVGNHLHLKVKITCRQLFQSYLKALTGIIARKVTGARKGRPIGRFWEGVPFTRVLKSALEEVRLRGYIEANRVQANSGYAAREDYLDNFGSWVSTLTSKPKISSE